MHLGIDVGGTNTDGVILDHQLNILASQKITTRTNDLMASLKEMLTSLLTQVRPNQVQRLTVSSTLGLNALLTGRADQVGVLAVGGPGLPPDLTGLPLARTIPGGQDHLGRIITPIDQAAAEGVAKDLATKGIKAWAVVTKFAPKNPALEMALAQVAIRAADLPMTRGTDICGRLNFPRRLNTAIFNSAVLNLYRKFLADLTRAATELGLTAPINLLTADGATLSVSEAKAKPALILAAGPAAGLLGLWHLAGLTGDAVMVDVGGTSTDLAIMADGRPLLTPEGLTMAGRPTLIRAFLTHSLALGGDSPLTLTPDGQVGLGPNRLGPALALAPQDLDKRPPTLTDALNGLALAQVGNIEVSRLALTRFRQAPPEDTATLALAKTRELIQAGLANLLAEVNHRPVYTLESVQLARKVRPTQVAILGGPALALAKNIGQALNLPVTVPPQAHLANAVGAALARPVIEAELYADTAQGLVSLPALGRVRTIDRQYSPPEAEAELLAAVAEMATQRPLTGPAKIIEAQSFNQLSNLGRTHRIIRLRAQTTPGPLTPDGGAR